MRTTASVGRHPVHMMVVHSPMAFVMGRVAFVVAAAVGHAVSFDLVGFYLVAAVSPQVLPLPNMRSMQ